MTDSSPQKYNPKKPCFEVSQVDELTSSLCVVSQKHEDELMVCVEFHKYQFGAGLLTVANPVSRRLGAFEVSDRRKQRGTSCFLEKKLALAIVNGRHCCFCTQKLAGSGKTGTGGASQPIRMIVIEAPGSQSFTDLELLKLSHFTNVKTKLML